MDFYVLLGLDRSANTGDIKRAYKRLARRYHPDINPGDRAAESLYKQTQGGGGPEAGGGGAPRGDGGASASGQAKDEVIDAEVVDEK